MKFCWCTIMVADMDKSLKFYTEIVGLPLTSRFTVGTKELCFLGEGETQVELVADKTCAGRCSAEGVSLGFTVKSVDEAIRFITEKGLRVDSGPFQPAPRVKFFFVRDPDGVRIQFVENIPPQLDGK